GRLLAGSPLGGGKRRRSIFETPLANRKACLVEARAELQLLKLSFQERQARIVGIAQANKPQCLGGVIGSLVQKRPLGEPDCSCNDLVQFGVYGREVRRDLSRCYVQLDCIASRRNDDLAVVAGNARLVQE